MLSSLFYSLTIPQINYRLVALISFFFLGGLVACTPSKTSTSKTCDTTCKGCCDDKNECLLYADQDDGNCGGKGASCGSCSTDQECSNGASGCKTKTTTTVPDQSIQPVACGPTTTNPCTNGCCDPAGNCITTLVDTSCGWSGIACQNCTLSSMKCNLVNNTYQCGAATQNCDGKCQGELDGSGQACPANNCKGCCAVTATSTLQCVVGTDIAYCGINGVNCDNCSTKSQICKETITLGGTARACAAPPTCKISKTTHNANCCEGGKNPGNCYEDRCANGTVTQYSCVSGECVASSGSCSSGKCDTAVGDHSHNCGL